MKKKKLLKLVKVFLKDRECCYVCEKLGQKLSECNCMTDKRCAEHIIELFNQKEEKDAEIQ